MKILITTQMVDKDSSLLGFFHGWLLEFAKQFDEVYVICLYEGVHDLPGHVHIYSLGKEDGVSRLTYVWRFYKYFWRIFFSVKVDYVFFHMGAIYNLMAAPFFLVRRFYGVPFYWWKTHGHINFVGRRALWFVDKVFTAIAESFPIVTPKRRVVGHAIDTALFKPGRTPKQPHSILFVGRIDRSKRVEQVIEITGRLKADGVPVVTTCIGPVMDGPYFAELAAQIEKAELTEDINFIEGLPHHELLAHYQQAMVFINPSDNDGLDKVILEAILCGTLPLTANLSFASMLTQRHLFLEKGDIAGYVEKVKEIITFDESRYNERISALAAEIKQQHALDTLMARIFG